MTTQYRTKSGDMLDAICYKFYGRESASVDVLKANPGLAEKGAVYAAGIIINLPALTTTASNAQPVRLWD